MIYPHHDKFFKDYSPIEQGVKLVELISVARVRPRTSKGITDLLLPQTSICFDTDSPSKKYILIVIHRRMRRAPSKLHPKHPPVLVEVYQ